MKKSLIIVLILLILIAVTFFLFTDVVSDIDTAGPSNEEDEKEEIEPLVFNTDFSLIENTSERDGDITHIMIHFMSNAANPSNPYVVSDNVDILARYGVSVHYIIDREGKIYKLVPENLVAWHAGRGSLEKFPHMENRMNNYSIGIELLGIGTEDEMTAFMSREHYRTIPEEHIGFTEAQYEALNKLINDILRRNPTIQPTRDHIVGHNEWTNGARPDPGVLFNWDLLNFNR